MKNQINTLRQLQELVLIREEHHKTGDGSQIEALNDQIDELKSRLTPQVAGVYERLYKRSLIVMSAMTDGNCAVCGMQVPIAQAQQVRLAQHLVTCSSCGRILFSDDGDGVRNVTEKPDREDVRTGVSRFSAECLMCPELKATTPQDAIAELAQLMEDGHFISSADALTAAAMGREAILTTAMEGSRIAFPHVRGVEGGGLTFAVGVSRAGIDWDGTNTANIIVLSAIPVAVSAFYLRLLADLVHSFKKGDAFDSLMAADSPSEMWKTLVKVTRAFVK